VKPFYESERATLYCADAGEVMPGLESESMDLLVTDPPYGVEWQSRRRAESFEELAADSASDREGIRAVVAECVRLLGQHRHLYVFGPADALEGLKVSAVAELVWDKGLMGSGSMTAPWGPQHERISFAAGKHRHAGKSGLDATPVRMRKGSVLRHPRPTGRKVRHPTEKPVPLLRELIESSSRQGETVLDPFAGIGSTGVAALLLGRRVVLVEIDEGYAEIAAERLRSAEEIYEQTRWL
jgi:DNA modification methylase